MRKGQSELNALASMSSLMDLPKRRVIMKAYIIHNLVTAR